MPGPLLVKKSYSHSGASQSSNSYPNRRTNDRARPKRAPNGVRPKRGPPQTGSAHLLVAFPLRISSSHFLSSHFADPGARALPATPTVRLATEGDLPDIASILNREIDQTVNCFRTRPLTREDARRWWRGRENGRYPAWIGELDSQVVGWASLSRWSAYEAYDRTAEVSVWVLPHAQRRGLGRQFFSTLLEFAASSPLRVLLSRIEAQNQPSLRLHECFGFSRVGTMHNVGEKFGQILDVVIMERQMDLETPRAERADLR